MFIYDNHAFFFVKEGNQTGTFAQGTSFTTHYTERGENTRTHQYSNTQQTAEVSTCFGRERSEDVLKGGAAHMARGVVVNLEEA